MRPLNKTLFSQLESSGRFYRDSALGRLFHPGTVSYREKCGTDSVHLAVTPDNRVSVHVDSVSPLVVRDGRRCRYSVGRALAHNVMAAVEACQRMVRGHGGRHACHLDCEIVWVPDDEDEAAHGDTDAGKAAPAA